jgi:hypothetical protein
MLQPPQLAASLEVEMQEPLQFEKPVAHAHVPAAHFSPAGQAVPQAPQFELSVSSKVHTPLQFTVPPVQVQVAPVHTMLGVHVPPLQVLSAGHAIEQVPQCIES